MCIHEAVILVFKDRKAAVLLALHNDIYLQAQDYRRNNCTDHCRCNDAFLRRDWGSMGLLWHLQSRGRFKIRLVVPCWVIERNLTIMERTSMNTLLVQMSA